MNEKDLAAYAKATRKPKPRTAGRGRKGRQLNVRATPAELLRWQEAAASKGLALSAWLRVAANDRADAEEVSHV